MKTNKITFDYVQAVLMDSYESHLKGCTLVPDHPCINLEKFEYCAECPVFKVAICAIGDSFGDREV